MNDSAISDELWHRAEAFESFPRIVFARYRPEPDLDFLELHLDTGERLLIPREMLTELHGVSPAQAADLKIGPQGRSVWWPQLDDSLSLPDFLEHRWGRIGMGAAAWPDPHPARIYTLQEFETCEDFEGGRDGSSRRKVR